MKLSEKEKIRYWEIIGDGVTKNLANSQIRNNLFDELRKVFALRTVQTHVAKVKASWTTPAAATGSVKVEGNGNEQQEIELRSDRIVTLEDALKKAGTDLTKWDVERYIVNSWEVGAKGPDGKIQVSPLWQVKVWLKAKKGWNPSEFRAILINDLKAQTPSYFNPIKTQALATINPILVELSIFDAHFGKLAWSPETGQDYDIKICKSRYLTAARDLLGRAAREKPERILYVVGNDFFHVDHKGLTTAGTPQDMDGRWQKAFRIGKEVCITVAEEASQIAPVDILVVPGNHDREKAFCLGEVLAARFHENHRISVMNDPDTYSYYRYGKVLLGFVHGDNHASHTKRALLPQTMAMDRPLDWSQTVWREWHLGHFHSETEDVWRYRTVEHVRDVAVRVLPSLSSTDAWHRDQGYASVIAAECHLYHRDRGRYGYLVHQTTP